MKYKVRTFPNMRNGITDEFITTDTVPHTLIFVDWKDGFADITVFDPYKGSSREYKAREPDKTLAIVKRHLTKLGYTELTKD